MAAPSNDDKAEVPTEENDSKEANDDEEKAGKEEASAQQEYNFLDAKD